ncbi:MAG TPA: hypothetical protein VGO59_01700 [Verrucomicrobiae bacterium]|jgi:spermidine synthase
MIRKQLYLLFFVSGFCSLVYQMVWTRLAFASFGIITPVLSVVLSVFMLGLAIGSWAGGRMIPWLTRKTGASAIYFYGAAEFVIGLGAFATPKLFSAGEQVLLAAGQSDSFRYLFLSALVLAASILPWCLFMGATFPWMMAFVREEEAAASRDSFSFLYFANVLGAMTGTIITAYVLVETMGFHHTLALAAAGNFAIAAISVAIGRNSRRRPRTDETPAAMPKALAPSSAQGALIRWILLTTGFCAMAMEVVWTRAFTPVLKTQVYSFAAIVFVYLGATFAGSMQYRRHLRRNAMRPLGELAALLSLTAFLPIIAVDPRILPADWASKIGGEALNFRAVAIVLASICPMCAVLGYLTPSLIDQYAGGHPAAAGKAYGINVIGCILGPLFASYVLMPRMSERFALALLGLPLLLLVFLPGLGLPLARRMAAGTAAVAALLWSVFLAHDLEKLVKDKYAHAAIRRDYAASVISYGEKFGRRLLVNGMGMTVLASDTKVMVHLPMALHKGRPKSALIICFGMGTSFRAALSWDTDTTAVELVPSVVAAFPFYHADAESVLQNPKGRIIIDDGRRFLKRTRDKYDIIVIDPPPPVQAAGSSLLYSRQFYELAKEHLNTNGILQIWLPDGSREAVQPVARSLADSFPYLRAFRGVHGWGAHFLGSMQPMESATAFQLASRLPAKARADLMEWPEEIGFSSMPDIFQTLLAHEAPVPSLLNDNRKIEITDNQPFNEYYLLRRWGLYSP